MVTPSPASIVVVDFPFSDLSGSKLRPAVVLCDTGRGDWLLCQITSNPHSDPAAVKITPADLARGALIDPQGKLTNELILPTSRTPAG